MPSQPLDAGWDFGPVLGLIDSDLAIASPTHSPTSRPAGPTCRSKHTEVAGTGSLRLGDFTKLFKQLGISTDQPPTLNPHGYDGEDTDPDDVLAENKIEKEADQVPARRQVAEATPPHVAASFDVTPTRRIESISKQGGVQTRPNVGARIRPTTPVQLYHLSEPRKQASHKDNLKRAGHKDVYKKAPARATPAQQIGVSTAIPRQIRMEHGPSSSAPMLPADPCPTSTPLSSALVAGNPLWGTPTPIQPSYLQLPSDADGYFTPQDYQPTFHSSSLIPRTVQPIVIPRTPQRVQKLPQKHTQIISSALSNTLTIRPQIDRHSHFLNQLVSNFPEDKKWLVSPKQLCNETTIADGIHVFVDSTNIMIGFKEMLRKYGAPLFDMSFDCLALLMERRRPVAKRVFAGSHREAAPHPHVMKLVESSKAVGYENNVKEQVFIRREESERKKFFKDVERIGWTKATQRRSGNGSGSDSEMGPSTPMTPSAPKWVEQGVDEILHLKMCQSIIDTEVPTTMVVATGDGAEAEHSDGFLAQVERALKKGWKVELVSWKQQTSGGYTNKRFRAKWGDKFRIIELDEYLESLIDTP